MKKRWSKEKKEQVKKEKALAVAKEEHKKYMNECYASFVSFHAKRSYGQSKSDDIKFYKNREAPVMSSEQRLKHGETVKACYMGEKDLVNSLGDMHKNQKGEEIKRDWINFRSLNKTKQRADTKAYFGLHVLCHPKNNDNRMEYLDSVVEVNCYTPNREDKDGIARLSKSGKMIGGKLDIFKATKTKVIHNYKKNSKTAVYRPDLADAQLQVAPVKRKSFVEAPSI